MLERKEIEKLLLEINLYLKKENKEGEIILAGGAVMSLVYGARNSTHDIDALFKLSEEMRKSLI